MTTNPYAGTEHSTHHATKRGGILLRIAAVTLWLAVAILGALSALAATSPELTERYERSPRLFVTVAIVAIGLPLIGITLFGVASWQRSRWPLVAGAIAFLPLLLAIVGLVVRDAMR